MSRHRAPAGVIFRECRALIIIWVICTGIWAVLNTWAGALSWPLHDIILAALGIGAIVGWAEATGERLICELRNRNRNRQ